MVGVLVAPLGRDALRDGHCRNPLWLGHDDGRFSPPSVGDDVVEDVLQALR